MKLFSILFGIAFGFASWSNMPRIDRPAAQATALGVLLALYCAYRAGRSRSRGGATAIASATASASSEATATGGSAAVNVVVVNQSDGARARAAERFGGLDTASWIGGATTEALDVDADDIGMLDDREIAPYVLPSARGGGTVQAERPAPAPAAPDHPSGRFSDDPLATKQQS